MMTVFPFSIVSLSEASALLVSDFSALSDILSQRILSDSPALQAPKEQKNLLRPSFIVVSGTVQQSGPYSLPQPHPASAQLQK